jgi:hypothetical protein
VKKRLKDRTTWLRRRFWNTGLKLWWYRLWIRKDEFHPSLKSDLEAMLAMTREQCIAYKKNLKRRRLIAHRRDPE